VESVIFSPSTMFDLDEQLAVVPLLPAAVSIVVELGPE
jgi:hypothetical protein